MTQYSQTAVRSALAAIGPEAGMKILNQVGGVPKLSLLPPSKCQDVIEAAQAHAARTDRPAGDVDAFQQAGKANNDAANDYWNQRREAQAAGEPMPGLPADPHNAKQLQKLGRDQAAMREAAGKFWKD